MHAHLLHQFFKPRSRETLGQDVRQIVLGVNSLDGELSRRDLLANEVMSNCNVFRSGVELGVLGQLHRRVAVNLDRQRVA